MSAFTCPRCGAVSHNPQDAENQYCGKCHEFVSETLARAAYAVGTIVGLARRLQPWVVDALLGVADYGYKEELREIVAMRDRIGSPALGGRADKILLLACFLETDVAIALQVREGKVPKSAALVFFTAFRDVVRRRDAEMADALIPRATESVQPERSAS